MEAFADEFFRQQPLVNCPYNKEKLASTVADGATTAAATATTTATESPAPAEPNPTTRPASSPEPLELSLWRWVADEGFYCLLRAASRRGGAAEKGQQRSSEDLAHQLSEFTPVSFLNQCSRYRFCRHMCFNRITTEVSWCSSLLDRLFGWLLYRRSLLRGTCSWFTKIRCLSYLIPSSCRVLPPEHICLDQAPGDQAERGPINDQFAATGCSGAKGGGCSKGTTAATNTRYF